MYNAILGNWRQLRLFGHWKRVIGAEALLENIVCVCIVHSTCSSTWTVLRCCGRCLALPQPYVMNTKIIRVDVVYRCSPHTCRCRSCSKDAFAAFLEPPKFAAAVRSVRHCMFPPSARGGDRSVDGSGLLTFNQLTCQFIFNLCVINYYVKYNMRMSDEMVCGCESELYNDRRTAAIYSIRQQPIILHNTLLLCMMYDMCIVIYCI